MFSALKHRNFRLYLSGQLVSLIGTWMQQLATAWVVYRLTHSPFWLGVSVFALQIPMFAFGLLGGVVVDRFDRHKLLFWTQALAAVQAAAFAVLSLTGRLTLGEVIGLNLVLGLVNACDMPARQAFVVEMIDNRKDLPNAIALNSSMMNGTRLIGPAVAGLTISMFGEGICFLLNAVSYIAVLWALYAMKINPRRRKGKPPRILESLKEGVSSSFRDPSIRAILLLLAFMSLFGMPYMTLFPMIAAKVPGGGANTFGWMTSMAGFGALLGSLYLARIATPFLGKLIGRSSMLFGVFIFLLGLTCLHIPRLPLILPVVFVSGMGLLLQASSANTMIQTLVDDERRGRVMSMFSFSILGIAPFGSLLIGAIAQKIGSGETLMINGGLCLVGAWFFLRKAGVINQRVSRVISERDTLSPASEVV